MITWGISNPFELLSPASGQVTNVLLTRSPLRDSIRRQKLLVRLTCIKHAASVHPEPRSNSPQNFDTISGVGYGFFSNRTWASFSLTLQLLRFWRNQEADFIGNSESCQGLSGRKTDVFPNWLVNTGFPQRLPLWPYFSHYSVVNALQGVLMLCNEQWGASLMAFSACVNTNYRFISNLMLN